jgi:adenylate cyclase
MTPTVLALTVSLVVALVALGINLVLLATSRRRIRVLRAQLDKTQYSRAQNAAQLALRAVVGTAVRVRERGVTGFLTSSIEELTGIALADRSEIAKVAGPDGRVTILFSDIEDSTALNERIGDAGWVDLLGAHDKVVRRHVQHQSGHVVKSQGDGFMIVFSDPASAVEAAVSIQDDLTGSRRGALRRHPIKVRMGIHDGPVVRREGDIFGRNVALAARVASQASGGEILVSDQVHTELADDYLFVDCRVATLKGFDGEHQLWELAWPIT